MVYRINDKPPVQKAIPLALQHVLVAFTGTLAGSLLLASGAGLDVNDTALLIQCSMFISCIASLIQSLGLWKLPIGSKMPIVTSGSYTLISPMVAMACNPDIGLSGAFGAAFAGSVVLFIFGPLAITYLHKYFTPVVTGSVVLAVGMCLMGSGFGNAVNYDPSSPEVMKYFAIAAFTFVLAMVLDNFAKGFLQSLSILISIIVGFVLCIALGMVDFTSVLEAQALSFPTPVKFGMKFQVGPILTICAVHIATVMENVGDTTGIVTNAEGRLPTKEELVRTLRGDGLGSMIAALFNGLPVVSASPNAGVIAMTGVASRYVTALGALILGLLSFFPKFSQLLALIPNPVLGGILLVTFGSIASTGIRVISMGNLSKRNITILAVSLVIGIGGGYAGDYLSFLPTTVLTLFTGISGTALSALLLNIILPKTEEDRKYIEEFSKTLTSQG